MPYNPSAFNFRTSSGTDLANLNLGWITKEYLMSVYPQIANQITTPELWGWGSNYYAALGVNDNVTRCTPVTTFAGGANWKQVSCGYVHVMAIKTDGTLWGWGTVNNVAAGSNLATNIYSGANDRTCTPVTTFAGGTNWKQIACGGNSNAAIKTDGTLWVWGSNYGLGLGLGNVADYPPRATPVTTIAGGTNWKQVSVGQFDYNALFMGAVKTDGTLWTWGGNYNVSDPSPLGINRPNDSVPSPVTTFAGGTNWKQVSCGWKQMAAVKTDGTLWVWGSNSYAELGTNNNTNALTPVTTFAGGTNWKQVSCGLRQTMAIKTDGTLWYWGLSLLTPVTTSMGGTTWKQVSRDLAVKTDGTLWSIIGSSPLYPGTNWKQVDTTGGPSFAIKSVDSI